MYIYKNLILCIFAPCLSITHVPCNMWYIPICISYSINVEAIMAAFAFCTHADVWMQNKHLELKQEGLFLAGKICQWNLKASISLSHLLAELETFLKLHVRQSWLKLMKWSGKQNVYLKIQISGPLANPALQAKLCILCTNCSHKTKCKNTAVPPIHEIPRTG